MAWRLFVVAFTVLVSITEAACKKEPGGQSAGSSNNKQPSASGAGAVSANDQYTIYQNLRITVPWKSDHAQLIKSAQEAAEGNGLTLSDGKTKLKVTSDGKTVILNGQSYGNVQPNDRIVLQADGKLLVNDSKRKPVGTATTGANASHP